ncbi:alanyl-tRNA editing protein, partial [Mesorhizobium sp. M00.F.Ca.ET.170.01.1.1]
IGERLKLAIDWERRHLLMRMHAACHLLTVVCPFPITGAAVSEDDSAVDFDIPDANFTKEDVTARLMELVRADHPIFTRLITDGELSANPGLVKSKNVRPPVGTGRIRLVCIGE